MAGLRIFAALVVAAFYGASLVDGALFKLVGLLLLAGLLVLGYGILRPARR